MLNAIVAPGELFQALVRVPVSVANWLIPALLVAVMAGVAGWVVYSQPVIIQEIRQIQDREFDRAVEKGKMKAEEAEKARALMEQMGPAITRWGGVAGGVLMAVVAPLWWGLILLLTARWGFRAMVPYMRCVEVAALASLATGLGMVVWMFLAIGTGRLFAGPHAGALVSSFDLGNKLHLALGALNIFSLWQLGIQMVGLAALLGRPLRPVAIVLGGVWLGYKGVAVILGLGQFAL